MSTDRAEAPRIYASQIENSDRIDYLMLTEQGGQFFDRLKSVAGDKDISVELSDSLKNLIDFYSGRKKHSPSSLEVLSNDTNPEDDPVSFTRNLRYPIDGEIFVKGKEVAAGFLDLILPDNFLDLMKQLVVAGEYASFFEAFTHVGRYAMWRLGYKKPRKLSS